MIKSAIFLLLSALLLALGVFWKTQPGFVDRQTIISEIESNVNREVKQFKVELNSIALAIRKDESWPETRNAFFLQNRQSVIKWNTNRFFPDPILFNTDSIIYYRNGESHYLVIQVPINEVWRVTGFLTLQNGFSIRNEFLETKLNARIFPNSGVSFLGDGNDESVYFNGRRLFSIAINEATIRSGNRNVIGWIALVMGLGLLCFLGFKFVRQWIKNDQRILVTLVIFLALLSIRLVMVYGHFPDTDGTWPLFNPKVFASSAFNNSIGNLLLNTISLLISAVVFYFLLRNKNFWRWRNKSSFVKILVVSVYFIFFFASQLLPFLYLETIYHNSNIIPDISQQLQFDPVRSSAMACIVCSALVAFYSSITFFKLSIRVSRSDKKIFWSALIIATLVIFLYHMLTERNYQVPILLTVVNLLVLFYSSIGKRIKYFLTGLSALILFELIIYALQGAFAIQRLSVERERQAMVKFGNTFLIERDILGEYLLAQTISKIEGDAFIQQQMVNPFNRLNSIDHKVKQSHLNAYFDRYDIQIYLYDNRGKGVGNGPSNDLATLVHDFVPIAQNTDYNGIYIIKNPTNRLVKRYLAIVPLKYHVSGYIVLDLTLRQILPTTVFPNLLLDSRFSNYAKQGDYSYAVYNGRELVNSVGDFNYKASHLQDHFQANPIFENGVILDSFDHIGVRGQNDLVVIISVKKYAILNWMANFSFYFFLGLVIVVLSLFLFEARTLSWKFVSYSNRIRLYVYLALVLPLLALAITILRLNSYAEEDRIERINVQQAKNIAGSLVEGIISSPDKLQEDLIQQAQGAGVDVAVYSKAGKLMATSQPDIYSNQLMSRFIHPRALQEIGSGKLIFTIDDEIGTLKFRNTFSAVVASGSNDILALVSLPFFESQTSFEKDQIRLVSNILGVFVIVFLLFYLLSFIALDWLTSPLRSMAISLQRITLSGSNRKLVWNSKDEIGNMVREYNKMTDNLAKSRAELEKRQREAAWREIARQVAHEIKNPLTPIKLTLQQLQKSFREGNMEHDKFIRSLDSVLGQVDILNDIASSFSAFAQMPELKLERVNMVDIIQESISLFTDNRASSIVFNVEPKQYWVMGDHKLFARIFSNILLNALQSEREGESIKIDISVFEDTPNITLIFADNGHGMPQEVLDKIFIPYFSTKDSGSGLGLAIAKQGVEQSGGRIWCESKPGYGTTFFISLPLIR